jgi:hypothetical protein
MGLLGLSSVFKAIQRIDLFSGCIEFAARICGDMGNSIISVLFDNFISYFIYKKNPQP